MVVLSLWMVLKPSHSGWNQWKTSTDCGTKKPFSVRTALSLVPIPMLHVHHHRLQPATMHTDLIQCRSSSKSLKTRLDFILASAEQCFRCIRTFPAVIMPCIRLVQPSRWEEGQRDTVHTPVYARRVPPCHRQECICSHNIAGVSSEHNGL